MFYFVYALKSKDRDYIYVGMTDNIDRRVREHNRGYNKSTKPYRPFSLIYSELCDDRISARSREKFLKAASGKRFLKALL